MSADVSGLEKAVRSGFAEKGYRAAFMPALYIQDLVKEFEAGQKQAGSDKRLHNLYRAVTKPGRHIPQGGCVIVTAIPQPLYSIEFDLDGKTRSFIIPPTYYYETDRLAGDLLNKYLRPAGFGLSPVSLPLKLLAARSGLARYGRNNITYVEGMGSFFRLKAFYCDIPATGHWHELQPLLQCQHCTACIKKCPTGAITGEKFQVRVDSCLTFFNEMDDSFPGWIQPGWHNSLIGCMHCQTICPVNKPFLSNIEKMGSFSRAETRSILAGAQLDRFPSHSAAKLRRAFSFMLDDFQLLQRNLAAIINRGT